MRFRLLPFLMLLGGGSLQAQGPTFGIGKDPDRRRNPCLGYLHQSYGRGAPAGARNGRGRRAGLSGERVRGMPRGDSDRWRRSKVGKGKTRSGTRYRPLEFGANPADPLAVRDDGMGLHQSRHASG